MTTIAERVANGAAYLDAHDPGWWRPGVPNAIDLDKLALDDGGQCILGQRCPLEYDEEESAFDMQLKRITNGENVNWTVLITWAAEYGFTFPPGQRGYWGVLTQEWRRVITERRSAS